VRKLNSKLRQEIRDYIGRRRQESPGLKASEVLSEVNRRFGEKINLANFYVTYWGKAKPNGSAAEPEEPTPPSEPPLLFGDQPVATTAGRPAPAEDVGPFFSLAMVDGSVLVRLQILADPLGAGVLAALIGQGLQSINWRET